MEANIRKEIARIRKKNEVESRINLEQRLTNAKTIDTVIEVDEGGTEKENPRTKSAEKMVSDDGNSMDVDDSTMSNLVEDSRDSDSNSDQNLVINEGTDDPDDENANEADITGKNLSESTSSDPHFQPKVRLENIDDEVSSKKSSPAKKRPITPNENEDLSPSKKKERKSFRASTECNNEPTTSNPPRRNSVKKNPKLNIVKKTPARRPEKDTFRTCIRDFMISKCRRENELVLNTNTNHLRKCIFELNPDTSMLTITPRHNAPMDHNVALRDIHFELKHLLYWPGISLSLNLPELEIKRKCVPNASQELVKLEHFPDPAVLNDESLKRYYKNQTMQSVAQDPSKDIEIVHEMVILYLELILKVTQDSERNRQAEIVLLLETIIQDLQKLKRSFLNINYSYFLNKFPYSRLITHTANPANDETEYLQLRETYNPEIVFKIKRCNKFEERKEDMESDFLQLETYFINLLENKNERAQESFNSMLQKSVTAMCMPCGFKHHGTPGPTMVSIMEDHIKQCCAVPLKCLACNFVGSELELANMKWNHTCLATPEEQNGN